MSTRKEVEVQVSYGYLVHVYNMIVESVRAVLSDPERALEHLCDTCLFVVTDDDEDREYLHTLSTATQALEWEVDKVSGIDVWTKAFHRKQYKRQRASVLFRAVLDKFMRRLKKMKYFDALRSMGIFPTAGSSVSGEGDQPGYPDKLSSDVL